MPRRDNRRRPATSNSARVSSEKARAGKNVNGAEVEQKVMVSSEVTPVAGPVVANKIQVTLKHQEVVFMVLLLIYFMLFLLYRCLMAVWLLVTCVWKPVVNADYGGGMTRTILPAVPKLNYAQVLKGAAVPKVLSKNTATVQPTGTPNVVPSKSPSNFAATADALKPASTATLASVVPTKAPDTIVPPQKLSTIAPTKTAGTPLSAIAALKLASIPTVPSTTATKAPGTMVAPDKLSTVANTETTGITVSAPKPASIPTFTSVIYPKTSSATVAAEKLNKTAPTKPRKTNSNTLPTPEPKPNSTTTPITTGPIKAPEATKTPSANTPATAPQNPPPSSPTDLPPASRPKKSRLASKSKNKRKSHVRVLKPASDFDDNHSAIAAHYAQILTRPSTSAAPIKFPEEKSAFFAATRTSEDNFDFGARRRARASCQLSPNSKNRVVESDHLFAATVSDEGELFA
ncbi:hypothetical protein RUND412_001151 [Rhizina undulata]